MKCFDSLEICLKHITNRLALLAHLVCTKTNFQGLLWYEFGGLGKDELKKLFLLS